MTFFCVFLQWFGHIVQINLQKRGHDILEASERLCKSNEYKCKWQRFPYFLNHFSPDQCDAI